MSTELIEAIRGAKTAHERARVQAVLDARTVRGDASTLTSRPACQVRVPHVCSHGIAPGVPGPLGPPETPRPGEPTTVGGSRKGPGKAAGCEACLVVGPLLTAPGSSGRTWVCECGAVWGSS